jgi:hypothetical protein
MSDWVRLNAANDEVYVNFANVTFFERAGTVTLINFTGGERNILGVAEPPAEIARQLAKR